VRLRRLAAAGALVLLATGCRRDSTGPAAGAAAGDSLAETRALVEERRFDEAIARLPDGTDAEALYLLGRAWAGKAETAPVPTPAPGAASSAGSPLKPEEARALAYYERAVAARPDHAAAHLAIAELLAPHALVAATRGGASPLAAGGVDTSVDRVLRSFGDAVQADPAATVAVEAMIRFATRAGRVAEADGAFQELVRRRREDPDLLVRYGDFLAGPGKNADGALARYAQALIWRPDDSATRLKMADIHLAAASLLLAQLQYAAAEARLRDARRFITDPASAPAARLRELEGRLREIRGR
jgi:tetratricopeptide (TPR) repeat protein